MGLAITDVYFSYSELLVDLPVCVNSVYRAPRCDTVCWVESWNENACMQTPGIMDGKGAPPLRALAPHLLLSSTQRRKCVLYYMKCSCSYRLEAPRSERRSLCLFRRCSSYDRYRNSSFTSSELESLINCLLLSPLFAEKRVKVQVVAI